MTTADLQPRVPAGPPGAPSIHVAQRSVENVLILWAMGALFVAGVSVPSISMRIGVNWRQGMLVAGSFLTASTVTLLAYRRFGAGSRVYRCLDYSESFVLNGSIAYLIQASGTALSFFWIFHLVHVLLTAFGGFSLLYALTISVAPTCLSLVFFLREDTVSGWLSALAGLSGLAVYANVARFYSQYLAALKREAELRGELARVLVTSERTRISRDLHDNVTTELTALIWKVRELSDTVPAGPGKLDIQGVAERLRAVIDDLRNVVLALRRPELDFGELKQLLENRVRELCSPKLFSVEIEGQLHDAELSAFQAGVLPICFELVQNAVTHSGATRVELGLQIGSALHLRVHDDGAGLPEAVWLASEGGLRGVKARVARLHGHIELQSSPSGALISVEVPRPLELEG